MAQGSAFSGTESRLRTLVELLRQIAVGSEADPQVRLEELQGRRRELDLEIVRASAGGVEVLNGDGVRDASDAADATALVDEVHVDPVPLEEAITDLLDRRATASLADVLETRPLDQGLAELVTSFALRPQDVDVVVDDEREQVVRWTDGSGPAPAVREARAPAGLVPFSKKAVTTTPTRPPPRPTSRWWSPPWSGGPSRPPRTQWSGGQGIQSTRRPTRLGDEELALFGELVTAVHGQGVRLEQERIRFSYADRVLERVLEAPR